MIDADVREQLDRMETKLQILIELLVEEDEQQTDLEGNPLPKPRGENEIM